MNAGAFTPQLFPPAASDRKIKKSQRGRVLKPV